MKSSTNKSVSEKPDGAPARALILIIEDDPEIQEMLSFALGKEGWKLVQVQSGEAGLEFLQKTQANCILLDIMLPGMDGLKAVKKIREIQHCRNVPLIMTTAKGEEADIVTGLELGADDYVVKPYSPKVLIARIRASLRRQEEEGRDVTAWQQGDLRLDAARHEVFCGGRPVDLFATEFALLQYFLSHSGRVFSRNQLIAAIHGPDYPVTDRSIDVQILGLRKKLGKAGDLIETIRGVGYRMKAP
ncbi:MAG: response regulator transcription factor [Spirochaetia bacterium]|jgi:two-component system phosphate regulon response regulator PhoB|nr:response regulator transcription factor [Spirochaetia bacterium]